MPHADIGGQRLYYEETGSGDDVIVFSHGLFMDHSMFEPQVEAVRDRWRCITWDERAHGATQSTDEPFDYWDMAGDLLGLLDHLGIERAVLAGMSQGGFLSFRAALKEPERVRALVLMDTQTGVEGAEKIQAYNQLVELWTAPDGPPQQVLDTVSAIILGPDFAEAPHWQERWVAMPNSHVRQAYETLVSRADDVAPRLSELTMPALVLHGEQDLAIEHALATQLAAALPDGELVSVPGAGHAANLTHPDQVNPALVSFLERV
jgi:pimeloyl-ACP methyl ester carboxylesterase